MVSLKSNSDFQNVYRHGKSYANKYFIMYILENDLSSNRFGLSVSKKVGNSVVRHHIKRLLRESIRLHNHMLSSGLDIVIVVRPNASNITYNETVSAFLHLTKLHKILI